MHGRIVDRHQRLNAPVHVPLHPVGRTDENPGVPAGQQVAVAEGVDAAVLQEPPDDRLDADILRQPGHARPQAADAADHRHDLHAGAGRLIQRVDQFHVGQAVHLQPDGRRLALAGEGDFLVDQRQQLGRAWSAG